MSEHKQMTSPRALKVLAVDDQSDNLITLKAVLSDAMPDCELYTARSGSEGIELIREQDPDTVVLDIVMPDMDGFEVCRRLKADEQLRDIPVIFLTALGSDEASRRQALEVGGEAFLAKPLDAPQLVAQIRAMAKIKAARQLRRLDRDELAALVATRTRELELELERRKSLQAQIVQSDRLATMGMLAAGVAHEINNPLSYVLYNLESLVEDLPRLTDALRRHLDRLLPQIDKKIWEAAIGSDLEVLNPSTLEDIQARFKEALQGTLRIKDVARGLGAFSRVEKGRTVPVKLMHAIELAISMVSNELKYRARLVKDYGPVSSVLASDGKLSQVFLNMLINATHAIPEGDIEGNEIRVRTWQDGDHVCAEVRDTGKGISPEDLGQLFDPFFSTKEIGVGTGLGLAISKSIVEEYGGRIEVTSELGKWTSFIVRLPVSPVAEDSVTQAALSGIDKEKDKVSGRILVIDDEAGVRNLIARILRAHKVVKASSGEQGQQVLGEDQAFDLVLCDLMMPGLSGVDLHEWLCSAYPSLADKVVFITGGAFTPRARAYLNRVDNLRIEKPFDVANLKKVAGDFIEKARA